MCLSTSTSPTQPTYLPAPIHTHQNQKEKKKKKGGFPTSPTLSTHNTHYPHTLTPSLTQIHDFTYTDAGIGWLCFREEKDLHPELVFSVNYLGGDQSSFTLNFSRGASQIVGQYYNFLRLGREGYREVMANSMNNANYLREALVDTGKVG